MEAQWMMYAKKADFFGIGEKYNIDPVIARVIRNRDVISELEIQKYLYGDLEDTHAPELMKDMEKGCAIISEDIKKGKHIRIISDYDVDGVMSNYILYKGMLRVAEQAACKKLSIIDYDIPHRIYDGYGINIRMVQAAYDAGVDTIITCDNGIAAFDAVAYGKKLGMTMIVTDHHDIPYDIDQTGNKVFRIVEADAVIDHKQPDCSYPCKELCGAGVAYKFIQLLYRMNGIPEEECQEFIEYLGIATVCDIMSLVDENRIFVKKALEALPHSKNLGLRALIRCSNRANQKLTTFDLGFIIGPCINAAGRLGDARTSLEFLLEEDSYRAEIKAEELININNQRKDMTIRGTNTAIQMIEKNGLTDRVIVLYIPELHESLVGIVAGRIKERYYRPVLIFTDSEETDIIKGSGRSIEGYHMYDELNQCRKYFTKFGGHDMAAGFSMERRNLDALREALNANCKLDEQLLTPKLYIDVPMPFSYLTMELTKQLTLLEPFGKGNEKPVFGQSGVSVKKAAILGKNRNVLRLFLVMDNGKMIEGIYFETDGFISNIKEWFGDTECDKILNGMSNHVVLDIAYYPEINEYAGRTNLQVRILEYRKHK